MAGQTARHGIVRTLIFAVPVCLAAAIAFFYFNARGDGSAPTSGSVQVSGSETMRAAVSACAEDFMNRNPQADVVVRGGGSGEGIAALLHGIVEIGMVSRELSKRERDYATSKGIDLTEHPLALDGISIVVHRNNPVEALELAQVQGIFSGRIRNWRDVGGADSEIAALARAAGSGTAALFGARVLGSDPYGVTVRHLPSNDAIVSQTAALPEAIGYADLGALRAGGSRIKVLALRADPQSPAVTPAPEEIRSGRYPLSRTLSFVTAGQPSGTARAFVDFCLGAGGQALMQRWGYVGTKQAAP
jgi:phosphate transport system substrate-binding protein